MIATPFPRSTLLHVARSMPAAPQILAQLGKLLVGMEASLDDISDLLKRDPALTARIIRIANSVAYNTGSPFASIEDALARVGFVEVYRLSGFAAIDKMVGTALVRYGVSGAQLRENSLLTALGMEALAGPAGCDPRAAYTAGLLRSIGKIALERLTRDRAYAAEITAEGPLAEWELAFVGLTNCEAAAVILEEWRFEQTTTFAIRDHYAPTGPEPLAYLLNLAAGAAERGGHGLPGEFGYWLHSAEKFAGAGVTVDALEEATHTALERFGPVRAALG